MESTCPETQNVLCVEVPTDAQSGPVTVFAANETTTTALQSFTVIGSPTVSRIDPPSGFGRLLTAAGAPCPANGTNCVLAIEIDGSGFDSQNPANNRVSFAGAAVTVLTSLGGSATRLFVSPPSVDGPVTVETPAGSFTGDTSLSFTTLAAPSIERVSPRSTYEGSVVSVRGSNFDEVVLANNHVVITIGMVEVPALVASARSELLTFIVPTLGDDLLPKGSTVDATVTVTTPGGAASGPLRLVGPPLLARAVLDNGRLNELVTATSFAGATGFFSVVPGVILDRRATTATTAAFGAYPGDTCADTTAPTEKVSSMVVVCGKNLDPNQAELYVEETESASFAVEIGGVGNVCKPGEDALRFQFDPTLCLGSATCTVRLRTQAGEGTLDLFVPTVSDVVFEAAPTVTSVSHTMVHPDEIVYVRGQRFADHPKAQAVVARVGNVETCALVLWVRDRDKLAFRVPKVAAGATLFLKTWGGAAIPLGMTVIAGRGHLSRDAIAPAALVPIEQRSEATIPAPYQFKELDLRRSVVSSDGRYVYAEVPRASPPFACATSAVDVVEIDVETETRRPLAGAYCGTAAALGLSPSDRVLARLTLDDGTFTLTFLSTATGQAIGSQTFASMAKAYGGGTFHGAPIFVAENDQMWLLGTDERNVGGLNNAGWYLIDRATSSVRYSFSNITGIIHPRMRVAFAPSKIYVTVMLFGDDGTYTADRAADFYAAPTGAVIQTWTQAPPTRNGAFAVAGTGPVYVSTSDRVVVGATPSAQTLVIAPTGAVWGANADASTLAITAVGNFGEWAPPWLYDISLAAFPSVTLPVPARVGVSLARTRMADTTDARPWLVGDAVRHGARIVQTARHDNSTSVEVTADVFVASPDGSVETITVPDYTPPGFGTFTQQPVAAAYDDDDTLYVLAGNGPGYFPPATQLIKRPRGTNAFTTVIDSFGVSILNMSGISAVKQLIIDGAGHQAIAYVVTDTGNPSLIRCSLTAPNTCVPIYTGLSGNQLVDLTLLHAHRALAFIDRGPTGRFFVATLDGPTSDLWSVPNGAPAANPTTNSIAAFEDRPELSLAYNSVGVADNLAAHVITSGSLDTWFALGPADLTLSRRQLTTSVFGQAAPTVARPRQVSVLHGRALLNILRTERSFAAGEPRGRCPAPAAGPCFLSDVLFHLETTDLAGERPDALFDGKTKMTRNNTLPPGEPSETCAGLEQQRLLPEARSRYYRYGCLHLDPGGDDGTAVAGFGACTTTASGTSTGRCPVRYGGFMEGNYVVSPSGRRVYFYAQNQADPVGPRCLHALNLDQGQLALLELGACVGNAGSAPYLSISRSGDELAVANSDGLRIVK